LIEAIQSGAFEGAGSSEHKRFASLRIYPADRRIVREGDLEFNQFPQILAYWRSKDGPFGEIPPRRMPDNTLMPFIALLEQTPSLPP
jgi:hypothetical protein